ncbi:Glucan endo-1,3-alpha-glucosidase agn1 [Elasticomyces elasticus]|nr:Glucan endo-1,3-alpha-glucosidase agn1 [Elasticomyces elasticus]
MYWYAMRGVFSGLPSGYKLSGYKFVDMNGDGKAELVWVDDNGQVTTWINRRGFAVGLGPQWVAKGVTHGGSGTPVNVTFGAFMGSGRADYALGSIRNGNVYVDRWRNDDHGGTMVKGDGTRFCDMTGDGSDDYVFINSVGDITLFENTHNWGYWNPWGIIYSANRARQEIHLADFDADKKCDILLVDKLTGATTVIKNNYSGGKFSFTNLGVVTGTAQCTGGYGSEKHDTAVRWADIDGDGRADFLCMLTDGLINGYLNKGVGNMVSQGQIKKSEGKERKNLRLADINGDGRADLLYVNMIDGAVTQWQNGGMIPSVVADLPWLEQFRERVPVELERQHLDRWFESWGVRRVRRPLR